jgi:FtsH-binding integral membrane protein
VGAIASTYNTDAVLLAVGGTAIICIGLGLFAWQTKIDFTAVTGSLFVILLAFILFGIVVAIDPSRLMRTVYAGVGLLIFGLFLVLDVQVRRRRAWQQQRGGGRRCGLAERAATHLSQLHDPLPPPA